jgi:hypothetical protein
MFRLFGRTAVTANSPSRASPLSDNRCVMISIRLQPLCYRQGAMSLNAEKCQNSIARSAFTSAKVSPSFRLNRNAFFPTKAAKLWWASDRIFALLYGDAQGRDASQITAVQTRNCDQVPSRGVPIDLVDRSASRVLLRVKARRPGQCRSRE